MPKQQRGHKPGEKPHPPMLVDLVDEAVRLGRVQRSGARVILLTRVLDVSIEELAADMGAKSKTIRKRRDRAEAALQRSARVA